MRPERFLVVIAERHEQEKPCQKSDNNNADRGSGEELEMKVFLAEQPRRAAAENAPTNLGFLRRVGVGHYKFHKANSLPAGLNTRAVRSASSSVPNPNKI
jgi:hypothetical protein